MMQRASRGVTLLEVMATMAVMLLGVAAAMTVVSQTSTANRRTLTANQAQIIAEQTLENILTEGCQGQVNCADLTNRTFQVYQTSEGLLRNTPPTDPNILAREYTVNVDVDNVMAPLTAEGGKWGNPPVNRPLVGATTGNLVNVRVSVSWEEPNIRSGRQVVVLQTRMAQ
ncbi:type II secretion system protein [Corallococcus praedator]|uniref:Type II secretion system protein n=1 Tax=Corallococcus praedator TaxID=2316724 RepID=A0ABX9QK15_9BACT|nr:MULTISPECIES: type II secretion system protein [Corallococcus]RKH15756.1 type II secretion system protein [Corallococcus sp. CA047B]RKH30012.1 type II secretion system protein [Corallococcus sp. CA031C]RKI09355.1 type II secretion system protein [Corallococcus praedator]